ncbi:MAG: GH25 family lysozyme [Blautia sp.]|jgi:GH25 family lysozyme M1 (1,4-beta-N-acetylmuramidase)
MEIYGIDVSAYEQVVNYEQVAAAGKRVAILRVTERNNRPDSTFEVNYDGFRQAGLKVGVYKFSYALSVEEADTEAEGVLAAMRGRDLDYPVYYDLEWSPQRNLSSSTLNTIIRAFRRRIVDAGYRFGIYCNTDWYRNVLDIKALPYDYWLAAYPYHDDGAIVESLRPPYGTAWQYSSKGRVPGIVGNVDLDVFYKDYGTSGPEEDFHAIGTAVSTGDDVNVRATPDGIVLRTVNKGNRFEIDGQVKNGWYHVNVAGTIGYIYGKYVKKDEQPPKAPGDWVRRLQEAIGTEPDNIPGPKTLAKCPLLAEGSRGTVVKLLQERLGEHFRIGVTGGYDGIFGPGTKAAVMEFQKQKRLAIDGIVGPDTWRGLLGL